MSLVIKNIAYDYEDKNILKNISFSISKGEIISLVAPSGYGKTTLAQIIAGMIHPKFGDIIINGKNLTDYNGFLPVQLIHQHPEKSINPSWKVGKILNEGWEVSPTIKQKLGIKEYWLDKWPNELSGGELQRVCLARAISPKTEYLIADEITSMLDAISQVELLTFLREKVKDRNLGILFISHDRELVNLISNDVIDLETINGI
ncbi:ABC transporter ATP-binding protein [Ignavigranum ruoffiae]|uniref:ABC transporter ATP-binding protein n=1 Tax=Ignavigranum ruoffiae TaxID=89093 RepID=UPI0024AE5C00|nr:ATP-binding cassette domain-containing protein [Ignavigranum ruoffiae]